MNGLNMKALTTAHQFKLTSLRFKVAKRTIREGVK